MPFWNTRESDAGHIYCVGTWYKCLRTLLSLVSQPWWERIWIVQEVMLSPNASVNIGRHQTLLSSLFIAARNYAVHCEGCCGAWTALWHGQSHDIFLPLIPKMRIIKDLGKVINDSADGKLVPISLALLSQERKATDPRDHFYAITGLMKHPFTQLPLGPVPDYRLDPAQLFTEQTLSLMQQSDSIDLLDRAIGVSIPNPHGLPSWACDWSHFRSLGWRSSLYNASKGHEHRFRHATGGTFVIAGVSLGVISQLGNPVNPDDKEDIAVKVEQWQHMTGTDQVFDICDILRATFLDMIMPREGQHRRLNPSDMKLLEEWWCQYIKGKKWPSKPTEDPEIWYVHAGFRYHMIRDIVYATHEGHFGVGPRTLCVGDEIFVVQGSKVPLILRFLDGGSMEEASSPRLDRDYSYVGRCYLHGYMDGEAMTPETEWQTLRLH